MSGAALKSPLRNIFNVQLVDCPSLPILANWWPIVL